MQRLGRLPYPWTPANTAAWLGSPQIARKTRLQAKQRAGLRGVASQTGFRSRACGIRSLRLGPD